MKYQLTGQVTISVYTEVEAKSKQEAIKIASERSIESSQWDSTEQRQEVWISDEYDGEVENIEIDIS